MMNCSGVGLNGSIFRTEVAKDTGVTPMVFVRIGNGRLTTHSGRDCRFDPGPVHFYTGKRLGTGRA